MMTNPSYISLTRTTKKKNKNNAFFHVLTKMNYRHMQNALEGINMYIKKPVMYYTLNK